MKLSLDDKIAGVLVPVFAIRGSGDLGIGDTAGVCEFIDWAARHGFTIVKILPINETGGDHSPYNAISSIALEPTTLRTTPDALEDIREEEYQAAVREINAGGTETRVNYDVVKPLKRRLLEFAFARFYRQHFQRKTARRGRFTSFLEEQAAWIEDYAFFRALVDEHGHAGWSAWPEAQRSPSAARAWLAALPSRKAQAFQRQMRFHQYVQWQAFQQWHGVKAHAESRGVALMGDIPFGISFASADGWAHPELFREGWCGGTPPDKIFKHDPFVVKWGQNWGIPLYDWGAMRGTNFDWWRQRVRGVRQFFHLFRIDHVLGFYRIYGFPWRPEENADFLPLSEDQARERSGGASPGFQPRPDDTAENKEQNRRDGEEYLRVIVEEAGAGRVIGEDLGEVPDYVRPSLQTLGIAGYKIPQWEKRPDGNLIPGGEYERLSLATYGTHDHDPLKTIWEQLNAPGADDGARYELRVLREYAGMSADAPAEFTTEVQTALLRALFGSNSWIAVVMITDVFGRSERFNFPGVSGSGNWVQRMHVPVSELDADPVVERMTELVRESGRFPSA